MTEERRRERVLVILLIDASFLFGVFAGSGGTVGVGHVVGVVIATCFALTFGDPR